MIKEFVFFIIAILIIGAGYYLITSDNDEVVYVDNDSGNGVVATTTSTTQKTEPSGSLVGDWKQVGCAYSDGSYVDCIISVAEYARIMHFKSDGTVDLDCEGTSIACEGYSGTYYVKGDSICIDQEGSTCFAIKRIGNDLLYCLQMTGGVTLDKMPCEKLQKY